ncbi:hypothetical protein F5J12DRAFT_787532 [Pisolithus orientalis]|uniref:uncharacterized protein n=1 Tax=Pisolithus orientalis TaxID=936130 RepID=UPI002224C3DE|nr:uncharacterized protein F5J12DRAFT_787532 [Pisolithus orientalis]KAI5984699.1 hypothetical protein F5J12DRAFT_787532 [Pisolithus orientalis]
MVQTINLVNENRITCMYEHTCKEDKLEEEKLGEPDKEELVQVYEENVGVNPKDMEKSDIDNTPNTFKTYYKVNKDDKPVADFGTMHHKSLVQAHQNNLATTHKWACGPRVTVTYKQACGPVPGIIVVLKVALEALWKHSVCVLALALETCSGHYIFNFNKPNGAASRWTQNKLQ